MDRLKVKDNPNLQRDTKSNGIINTDESAYKQYIINKRKNKLLEEQKRNTEERINNLEDELKNLKNGINRILEILKNDKS